MTALISEILVHSLEAFADAANLSEFFISIVIVAIVGNAAEHGGAIVIAHRGKMKLATEIAVSSSAQVGLFVIPVVALLSFLTAHPLALSFRPIELIGMGGAAAFVGIRHQGRPLQALGGPAPHRRLRGYGTLVPGRRGSLGRLSAPRSRGRAALPRRGTAGTLGRANWRNR